MEIVRGEDVYYLRELLGKGAYSNVYYSKLREETYAIKVIKKTGKAKEDRLFRLETSIHSSVTHPNIVKYNGHFENAENYYIILEYCNSKTLLDLFRKTREFSLNEITGITLQLIDAVSYLHSRNIIHGDIKLGNIFMHDILQVKLGDFGLATQLRSSDEIIRSIRGTPNYMAPEILNGNGYSFSVDIWAICVVLFALVYKKMPFEMSSITKTYDLIKACKYHSYETREELTLLKLAFHNVFNLDISSRMSLNDLKDFILRNIMEFDECSAEDVSESS